MWYRAALNKGGLFIWCILPPLGHRWAMALNPRFFYLFTTFLPLVAAAESERSGIESMRSHQWSVGIFAFLIICILVFAGIVIKFMTTGRAGGLKTGEKALFAWIMLGVVVAVIFGALQLLQGRLF